MFHRFARTFIHLCRPRLRHVYGDELSNDACGHDRKDSRKKESKDQLLHPYHVDALLGDCLPGIILYTPMKRLNMVTILGTIICIYVMFYLNPNCNSRRYGGSLHHLK